MRNLEGKVAVVSGGTFGVGRGIASKMTADMPVELHPHVVLYLPILSIIGHKMLRGFSVLKTIESINLLNLDM